MSAYIQFYMYMAVLGASLFCCMYRLPHLDHAYRFIGLFLLATLISEAASFYMSLKYHNNMPVYHIAAPVHFMLICLYFNSWLPLFRKRKLGLYLGLTGILLAIANTLFLQPIHTLNSYFLLFEGTCIISMSLYAFYLMLDDEQVRIMRSPHFWICYILLFFWSITYINWAMYRILGERVAVAMPYIGAILWFINMATYLGLGLVILLYPVKNKTA